MTDVNIIEAAELFTAWRIKQSMATKSKLYIPQHIERWYERINYTGDNFDGYYVAAWRLMRCHPVDRSNFAYIRAHVVDSVTKEHQHLIQVVTFTDDVYSYRYYVLVHESCEKALRMADMLAKRVKLKGSLDPDGEKLEDLRGVKNAWAHAKLETKVRMCREAKVSIFTARRQQFPAGTAGLAIYASMNETDVEAVDLGLQDVVSGVDDE